MVAGEREARAFDERDAIKMSHISARKNKSKSCRSACGVRSAGVGLDSLICYGPGACSDVDFWRRVDQNQVQVEGDHSSRLAKVVVEMPVDAVVRRDHHQLSRREPSERQRMRHWQAAGVHTRRGYRQRVREQAAQVDDSVLA